jgi:hypothetical protein
LAIVAETPTKWALLHAQLPKAALKELATSVYGVAGLTDVNEGYLIQRLFASTLTWEWIIRQQTYLGYEDKTSQGGKDYRVYMAAVHGELVIEGRSFHGAGASDNRKLDAAFKGAATVAFKNACKVAGLTAELYLDGRAIDHIYSERVLKDQTMVPERRIEEIVEWAEKAAPVQEAAGSDQRREVSDPPPNGTTATGGQAPVVAVTSPSPDSGELDLSNLFSLARTLSNPRTNFVVTNRVATVGVAATRRELILAHARDHGAACEHVAQVAGLK